MAGTRHPLSVFGWPDRDASELDLVRARWTPREQVADRVAAGAYVAVGLLFVLDLAGQVGATGDATVTAAAAGAVALVWSTVKALGLLARYDAGARTAEDWSDAVSPMGRAVAVGVAATAVAQAVLAVAISGNLAAAFVWPLAVAVVLVFAAVAGLLSAIVIQMVATLRVLFARPDDRPTALAISGVSALIVAVVVRRAVPDSDLAYRIFGIVFVASIAALLIGLAWGQFRATLAQRRG